MRGIHVKSLDEKGLWYRDRNKAEGFLDFETCKSEFVSYMAAKNRLSLEEERNLRHHCKTVAWRDITAKPMYVEFFSNPRVKVEFVRSLFCLRPKKEFIRLHQDIEKAGWSTYDLS